MKHNYSVMLVLGLLAAQPAAQAVPIIDTTSATFGGLAPFGESNTATYGQTFTVTGIETVLDDFSFRFNDELDTDFVDFAAYVYAWDGTKASGSQLFASSGISSTNNGGANGFEVFAINTGGLQLVSGSQYVAFFSASNFFDGQPGTSNWSWSTSDVYSGGGAVFDNNGSNFSQLTTQAWDGNSFGNDMWFIANFSADPTAVPVPRTLALFCLGLAGLGWSRRKKA